MLSRSFDVKATLYIATEPHPPKKLFNILQDTYQDVMYSSDLDEGLVKQFKQQFPAGIIRNDMLGILEQLLCVSSNQFCWHRLFNLFKLDLHHAQVQVDSLS
jgi:hypothetical protein